MNLLNYLQTQANKQQLSANESKLLVESFKKSKPDQKIQIKFDINAQTTTILGLMERILREQQFDLGKGTDFSRGFLRGKVEQKYDRNQGWLAQIPLNDLTLDLSFEVTIYVSSLGQVELTTNRSLTTWVEEFKEELKNRLSKTSPQILAIEKPLDFYSSLSISNHLRLKPGELLTQPFIGNLQDYSGCATLQEVKDLVKSSPSDRDHILPLGVWAFGKPTEPIDYGPPLYLGRFSTGARMEYNGTLVIAPQNSGKTQLIIRWSLAANQAGYNTFIVDVKGNLYQKLKQKGLKGKIYYFNTDPRESSDRLNFLDGLDGLSSESSWQIRQLVHAILPNDGYEKGEMAFYYQNSVNWLHSLIHLVKLYATYYPSQFPNRTADLCDLYELATDENKLYDWISTMQETEAEEFKDLELPFGGVNYWVNKIAILLDPNKFPGGQKIDKYSYQDLTLQIANALEPFSRHGILYSKVSSDKSLSGKLFSLEDLNSTEPITIIFAAREQDLDASTAVISMAIKRLQQLLFERMQQDNLTPILLLLDETRRIRSFKAGEYITFAREAKAGCVLVYQSIEQIKDEREATEILENVGTQIYLGSLVGNTAKRFIEILPKRYRSNFSLSYSLGESSGLSGTWNRQPELIDYFTTNELYHLPAGKWPALVYIKDHPSKKPFLVDMDEQRLA